MVDLGKRGDCVNNVCVLITHSLKHTNVGLQLLKVRPALTPPLLRLTECTVYVYVSVSALCLLPVCVFGTCAELHSESVYCSKCVPAFYTLAPKGEGLEGEKQTC